MDNLRVPVTRSKRIKGTIPYYGATGIVDYVDDYIFDEKLLLVGEDGADWSAYANTAYIIEGKSWVNNHAHVLRVTNADIDFLKEYLNYADLRQYTSGTTRGKLNKSDLMGIPVNLPPQDIQVKVSTYFRILNKQISITDEIIKNNEVLKQGIISDLFDKGKNNPAWKIVKLNTITSKITDGTHRTPKYTETGVPFLRINDIQDPEINWGTTKYISPEEHAELIKRCHPEKGDILLSKNGTIGITKIVNWDREFSIFVSLCLIKPDHNQVLSDYMGIVLGSDYLINQATKRSKQGTVTNLHLEEIRDFDVPLPDISEQEKIVATVSAVNAKLFSERRTKEKLTALKNGLMHDIFNRKVEVN